MSNPLYVKEYDIEIAGEKHTLKYDLDAFIAAEELGYSYKDVAQMMGKIKFSNVAPLLWIGMQHEKNSLTVEELNKILNLPAMIELQPIITEAVLGVLPEATEKNSKGPKQKA